MGEFSIFHWLVVLAVILIFFGGKRIPEIMKGFGEGIRSFKDGMSGASQTCRAGLPALGFYIARRQVGRVEAVHG